MKEIENRIFVNDEILKNEYKYYFGALQNENVLFMYYNTKFDREHKITGMNYKQAINLARNRQYDKRYKNYEFYIKTL